MHLYLLIALCALLARPAQVQTEPEAARSDSLSEQLAAMVERYQKKADNREDLRIAKKVVSGTLTTAFFTAVCFSVVGEVLSDGSYSDDGLEGLGLLWGSLYVGNLIGFPLGVSAVDPHDSLGYTLLGSGVAGLGGLGLVVGGAIMSSEPLAQIGFMASFIAPPIVSVAVSEASSNELNVEASAEQSKPQDRRVSFGLVPIPKGGLSAVATLRF